MDTTSRYANMEETIKFINQRYVSLKEKEIEENRETLNKLLEKLIPKMKEICPLFNKLFERIFFGGSYYDRLKIESPDEFDIDLVLKLPSLCEKCEKERCGCVSVIPSDCHGWFWLKVKKGYFSMLDEYIRGDYLQTDKILNWLKSVITRILPKDNEIFIDSISSESGPALTLRIPSGSSFIDIDLVPSFKFEQEDWPEKHYIENPVTDLWEFYIVPKCNFSTDYWRASFQIQERKLISDKERLKPVLRLLKKFKKNLNHHGINSYHLKTIVLNNLNNIDWNKTLIEIFMELLWIYTDNITKKRIAYYWNEKHNLISEETKLKIDSYQDIKKIIRKINDECKVTPHIIAKVILLPEEYTEFCAGNPNYADMDEIAIKINKKLLSIDQTDSVFEVYQYLDKLIEEIKKIDFSSVRLVQKKCLSDNYYDDLKILNDNKFNIGLLFNYDSNTSIVSNKPGWFWLKTISYNSIPQQFNCDTYINNLNWLHGVILQANNRMFSYHSRVSKSETAITVHLGDSVTINLIPSFASSNLSSYPSDLVLQPEDDLRNWVSSCIAEERQLLNTNSNLKSALRLLDKLKETMNHHALSGYCLKTIALNNIKDIDHNTLISEIFMDLLNKYKECLGEKEIRSYWNKKNNLLQDVKDETLDNYHYQVVRKIRQITKKCSSDPSILATVILDGDEDEERYSNDAIGIAAGIELLRIEAEFFRSLRDNN